MSSLKPKGRRNLSRDDWMDHAIQILATKGIGAVTVDSLAKQLGITRGSFYHHFEDRQDLLKSILDYWIEAWTMDIRESIANLGLDASSSLIALINSIRSQRAADYDAAIRSWAMNDEFAADYVRRADEIRLEFISSLFEQLGFEGEELEARARMLLYYEAFEPMMFAKPDSETSKKLIAIRHGLLTAR
ncbi:MAG: TetR/AcrR family transcriptional regulator [Pseudomonadota bacterium]